MKKLLSTMMALALVVLMVPSANAANGNPTFNLAVAGSSTTLDANDTVTVPANIVTTNGDLVTIYFKTSAGAVVNLTGSVTTPVADGTSDLANGKLVVAAATAVAATTVTFTTAPTTPLATGSYTVSISGNAGVGAAVLSIGNANQVTVTAIVEPTLSMALSKNSLALGILATSANTYTATDNLNVTTSTNAQGGVVVAMVSAGLKTATGEIGVTDISGVAQTAGTDYYKVSTNAAPTITDANGANFAAVAGFDMAATQNVVSNSVPHAATAVKVTVAARADATTEAGNYSDTLTFTATGTF